MQHLIGRNSWCTLVCIGYHPSTEKENGDSVEVNAYRNNSWIGSPVVIGRDAT